MATKRTSKPRQKAASADAPSWGGKRRFRRSGGGSGGRGRGTEILHACGHKERHKLPSMRWKRDRDKDFHGMRPCTACWASAQADEAEAALNIKDLPKLKGTPAQVRFARSIRAQWIESARGTAIAIDRVCKERNLDPLGDVLLEEAMEGALAEKTARYWLDHKDEKDRPICRFLSEDGVATVNHLFAAVPF